MAGNNGNDSKRITSKEIWQKLQQENYFARHRIYSSFKVVEPAYINVEDIKNKVMLEIGNGYGRNTVWFSKYADKIYGVDICPKILKESKIFLYRNKCKPNVALLLADKYIRYLEPLDYVFCRFVFQHIEKEACQEYINTINSFLKIGGKINLHFRLGDVVSIEVNKEPIVEYSMEEVMNLLSNFEITEMYNENKGVIIIGTKIK